MSTPVVIQTAVYRNSKVSASELLELVRLPFNVCRILERVLSNCLFFSALLRRLMCEIIAQQIYNGLRALNQVGKKSG